MNRAAIQATFAQARLPINEDAAGKLAAFYALLIEWNDRMNLTAITQPEEVIHKHFLDSCAPLLHGLPHGLPPQGASCVDVGSGAGFPGVPLAILRPDARFTLLESLGKRVAFLNEVITQLLLGNCTAVQLRAEEAGQSQQYRERFDISLSRAVAAPAVVAEYCLPLTKVGGSMLAHRGNADVIPADACARLQPLGAGSLELMDAGLPGSEHKLLLVGKQHACDARYPRRAKAIKSKPLFA